MSDQSERLVPDEVIPHKTLPPLRYRDMPEPISWRKMVGPSIILAGLSLGSGEFILWPYITYKAGFVFFWACLLGVVTQYFLNMEIERWTLATGESAITGFCRLSKHWAWVFLLLNTLPWIWPGWATGAGEMFSWMLFGPQVTHKAESDNFEYALKIDEAIAIPNFPDECQGNLSIDGKQVTWKGRMTDNQKSALLAMEGSDAFRSAIANLIETGDQQVYKAYYSAWLGIAGLFLVGFILTSGPVVYNTVERVQFVLVGLIFVLTVLIAVLVVRFDAVIALVEGSVNFGGMPDNPDLGLLTLLGALAFAGAGGTMNLGQSNFIKDKGYAMGKYIGRITSPITGAEEPTSEVGYHFEHTPDNMDRWNRWWRAANVEHLFSFFFTCVACLVLLSLIAYCLCYNPEGEYKPGMDRFGEGTAFVWAQAVAIDAQFGSFGGVARTLFLIMGVAIMLTTEFGVLDTTSRISTDIVKVNYLRENEYWTQSRLYYVFLWGQILIGSTILLAGFSQPLFLLVTSAAMNGAVMFIYSLLLLYLNNKILSRSLSTSPLRFLAMVWSCSFFGYFTLQALQGKVIPWAKEVLGGLLSSGGV